MAFGVAEDPALSSMTHLDAVEYPAEREHFVQAAEDSAAPPEVINLLKSLPRERYESREEAMRDLAEAARRFARGGLVDDDGVDRDRRNIGRDRVEGAPEGQTRHP